MNDRPKLRKRLQDEALASALRRGEAISTIELMLMAEAVATTMLEHPEWDDA